MQKQQPEVSLMYYQYEVCLRPHDRMVRWYFPAWEKECVREREVFFATSDQDWYLVPDILLLET